MRIITRFVEAAERMNPFPTVGGIIGRVDKKSRADVGIGPYGIIHPTHLKREMG